MPDQISKFSPVRWLEMFTKKVHVRKVSIGTCWRMQELSEIGARALLEFHRSSQSLCITSPNKPSWHPRVTGRHLSTLPLSQPLTRAEEMQLFDIYTVATVNIFLEKEKMSKKAKFNKLFIKFQKVHKTFTNFSCSQIFFSFCSNA